MTFTKEYLEQELKTKSVLQLAKELGTYPNKILRAAKKLGVKTKGASDAQKQALKEGRIKHPTKGKKLSSSHKAKIGDSVSSNWDSFDEDRKKEIGAKHKESWNERTMAQIREFHKKSREQVLKAAKEGSKTEHFIVGELESKGYLVEHHRKQLVVNENLELDILLPSLKIVIEINGKSHYEPIYGEEKLQKTIQSDQKKYGLLLSAGYVVIVLKNVTKSYSGAYHRKMFAKLMDEISRIEGVFPPEGQRLIEVSL